MKASHRKILLLPCKQICEALAWACVNTCFLSVRQFVSWTVERPLCRFCFFGCVQANQTRRGDAKLAQNSALSARRKKGICILCCNSGSRPCELGAKTNNLSGWVWRQASKQASRQPRGYRNCNKTKNLDFFPSNAKWLSPGRLSSRKDNCIVQIHRIKAVATLFIMTMWCKRELNWNDT